MLLGFSACNHREYQFPFGTMSEGIAPPAIPVFENLPENLQLQLLLESQISTPRNYLVRLYTPHLVRRISTEYTMSASIVMLCSQQHSSFATTSVSRGAQKHSCIRSRVHGLPDPNLPREMPGGAFWLPRDSTTSSNLLFGQVTYSNNAVRNKCRFLCIPYV